MNWSWVKRVLNFAHCSLFILSYLVTLYLPYAMSKMYSLFSQRYDSCSILCVRGKMCSFFCIKYDCCFALCVRGKTWSLFYIRCDCCSALCVRGKMCSLYFVRWWGRRLLGFVSLSDVRCEMFIPNAREVGMLVCWCWLGTCGPGTCQLGRALVSLYTFCNEFCEWMLSTILVGGCIVHKPPNSTKNINVNNNNKKKNNINIINLNVSHIIKKNSFLGNIIICYVEFTHGYKSVSNNLYVILNLSTDTDL